jgi:4a-hydroxytetrahydrobiopterin dehydratase
MIIDGSRAAHIAPLPSSIKPQRVIAMPTPLSPSEIEGLTARFPRWRHINQALEAEYAFPSYLAGIEFVRRVADVAEELNHHPDIFIEWRKVKLCISTHSAKAITDMDSNFVHQVEAIWSAPAVPG